MTLRELTEATGATQDAVYGFVNRHSLEMKPSPSRWTKEQIAFLKAKAGVLKAHEIARRLEKEPFSVYNKAHLLGISLRVIEDDIAPPEPKRREDLWDAADLAFLKQHRNRYTAKQLAERLNRSPMAIYKQLEKMGRA